MALTFDSTVLRPAFDLPQFDRAVQLYLETEADTDTYYLDSILACLVATVKSTGASQSTIKLVATSLIANNKLSGKDIKKKEIRRGRLAQRL